MDEEMIGADLFRIDQKVPYAEDYSTCIAQAKKDKQEGARPELISLPDNLDTYNEIYLGYPNYWGTMPMAVYTFLESFDFVGKKIHPFCTHAGSGLSGTIESIKGTCKGVSVSDGLAIKGETAQNAPEAAKDAVREFLGTK